MSFLKSFLSSQPSPSSQLYTSDIHFGNDLVALYETYWNAMRVRTNKIGKNVKVWIE
jgi:hypothetical protein